MINVSKLIVATGFALGLAGSAQAANLITNGNFETGDLSGWSTAGSGGVGSNSFYVVVNGGNGPVSGRPTQFNPANGNYFAIGDQNGNGVEVLTQGFTVASGTSSLTLSFNWFNASYATQGGTALDLSDQVMRADILTGSASPTDTGAGVVMNLLLNQDPTGSGNTSWNTSTFDLSGLAPGSYQLRFGTDTCCYYQELGVDNVTLAAAVPEPISMAILGTGLVGVGLARRKRA